MTGRFRTKSGSGFFRVRVWTFWRQKLMTPEATFERMSRSQGEIDIVEFDKPWMTSAVLSDQVVKQVRQLFVSQDFRHVQKDGLAALDPSCLCAQLKELMTTCIDIKCLSV